MKNKVSSKLVITIMAGVVGAVLIASKACASGTARPNDVTVTELTCAAVNQAIRNLPPEGGTVRLIKGAYDCTEPLAIERDNINILGAGKKDTILLSDSKSHIPVLVIGVMKTPAVPGQLDKYKTDPVHTSAQFYPIREIRNITVENLTVDGNRLAKGKQEQGEFECYIPAGEQSADGKFIGPISTRCDGDNGKWIRVNAITIRRASDVRLNHTIAKGAESGGLTVEKGSSRLAVDDFESSGNIFDGFAGYETDQSVFRNMYLHDNTSSGISIDFNFNDNTFENLTLVKNNDNGVFSHSVSGNKYINVTLIKNKNYGFWIDGWRTEEERTLRVAIARK
jgi:hypothetical protein